MGTGQIGVPCNVLARRTVESETPGRGTRQPAAHACHAKRFDMVARRYPRHYSSLALLMNLSHFFDTFRPRTFKSRVRVVAALASSSMLALGQLPITAAGRGQDPANPPQATPARPSPAGCRVTGRALSGTAPLPGVAIVVRVGDAVKAATSTDTEGKFTILFGPSATYHVSAELMAFAQGRAGPDARRAAVRHDARLSAGAASAHRGSAGRGHSGGWNGAAGWRTRRTSRVDDRRRRTRGGDRGWPRTIRGGGHGRASRDALPAAERSG